MSEHSKITCPESWCDWSTEFNIQNNAERIARKVDAGMHYVEQHGGKVPDDANFGNHQCPSCYEILGMDGTVSCSGCGFIPKSHRAENNSSAVDSLAEPEENTND